jgi:acyl-CoA thioesterase FadM
VVLGRREAVPLDEATVRAAEHRRVTWDVPPRELRPRAVGTDGFLDGARSTVKAQEIDLFGGSALRFYIHRFSSAGMRVFAAFGMTPAYMREAHRGFSTFEFQLEFPGELHAGDLVAVRTGVLHVGSSSIRIHHRMTREPDGELIATLDQFGVHLDTDARRPTPLPEALRARARALLVPTTTEVPA